MPPLNSKLSQSWRGEYPPWTRLQIGRHAVTTTAARKLDWRLSQVWMSPLPRLQTTGSSWALSQRLWSAPLLARRSYGLQLVRVSMMAHLAFTHWSSPPLSLDSDGPLSPPKLSTAVSKLSVSPVDCCSQHFTTLLTSCLAVPLWFRPPSPPPPAALIIGDSIVRKS